MDSNLVEHSFLPKIWAKQKIDALTIDYYLAGYDTIVTNDLQDQIDSISTCYGVVSTAFNGFSDFTNDPTIVTDSDEIFYDDVKIFDLFPNPVKDRININFRKDITSELIIKVYNSVGALVFSVEKTIPINGNVEISDLGVLTSGMYFIEIQIGEEKYIAKFLKI